MNDALHTLYQQHVLAHSRAPQHFGELEGHTHAVEAYNPICGDSYTIFMEIVEGNIVRARFYGHGCALSKAATSVLLVHVQGKPVAELPALWADFQQLLQASPDAFPDAPFVRDCAPFAAVRKFPVRTRCVTLSWEAVGQFVG